MQPQWTYVQARLQARHGERLSEEEWHALEAARSFDEFLDRARAGWLRRFAERLNREIAVHALEVVLRAEARAYVRALARWVPREWASAVLWTIYLPELPLIAAVLEDRAPAWFARDPLRAELVQEKAAAGALAPLVASDMRPLQTRWLSHWRALWPAATDPTALEALIARLSAHQAELNRAPPQHGSSTCRRDLAHDVVRLFRRHSGEPVALFCHLLLVALDLERLRGGLARRRLFAPQAVAA